MVTNYYEKMGEQLSNLKDTPKLLLHSCCAPCSSHVINLLTNYFDITVYYYNPNIYPLAEYEKRKAEQIRLIGELKTKNKLDYIDTSYDDKEYNLALKSFPFIKEGDKRCYNCYLYRMKKTAIKAKELSYQYFTTTLSVSPHKNSLFINEIGEVLEKVYDIKFLYSDFKKQEGYKHSIELAKKYNLYRQNYCGCIYSLTNKDTLSKIK
jgi:predicted adenine nucleotide alpha hydrolase (AANH) superfamily ATPase